MWKTALVGISIHCPNESGPRCEFKLCLVGTGEEREHEKRVNHKYLSQALK